MHEKINYAKQHHTPHCWLPAKVMYPAISTIRFSWLTRSTPILIVEKLANIYVYIYTHNHKTSAALQFKRFNNIQTLTCRFLTCCSGEDPRKTKRHVH